MFTEATPPALTNSPLDRADALRGDAEKMAALWASQDAKTCVFSKGEPLLRGTDLVWAGPGDELISGAEPVFLGLADGAPRFAVGLAERPAPEGTEFVEMRASLMGGFSGPEATIAATAKAVLNWHHTHRFCPRCGGRTKPAFAGWRRDCEGCEAQHFPRTDPVVIMMVVRGGQAALARNHRFPERMYSCIAGFIEPGESIEDAVARETFEELGLRTKRVGYVSSQPWPFGYSLMMGCIAETEDSAFTIEEAEIADAVWVDRAALAGIIAGTDPQIDAPRKAAIACTLMTDWLEGRIGFD